MCIHRITHGISHKTQTPRSPGVPLPTPTSGQRLRKTPPLRTQLVEEKKKTIINKIQSNKLATMRMHAIKFAFNFYVCPWVLHQPGKGNAQEPPPLDATVLPHVVNQT